MKKKVYLLWIFVLVGILIGNLNIVLAADESNIIPYPPAYNLIKGGASSYQGIGNVKNSPYYTSLDFYNLESTNSLIILPKYKTYQQTTEITCGPAAALTVLAHFHNNDWEELQLAEKMGTKPMVGTNTKEMLAFFQSIGWEVKSNLIREDKEEISFSTAQEFKEFVIANLKNNTPIMVENIDWGSHWRVIIGYDTMGTATIADDVLILADSYDTADHCQDGYTVVPAQKFFYMWFDNHIMPQNQQNQQWLTARPPLS